MMQIMPRRTPAEPGYPPRWPRFIGGFRRSVTSLGLSVALCCGCAGATANGVSNPLERHACDAGEDKQAMSNSSRNLDWCNIIALRSIGSPPPARMVPCVTNGIDALPTADFPFGLYQGTLCSNQGSGIRFRIASAMRARINLIASQVKLTLYAPDGTRVENLSGQRTCLSLDMEPGVWTVVVTRLVQGGQGDFFDFTIHQISPPSP